MIPIQDPALYQQSLGLLQAHAAATTHFRTRLVQLFLGLKFNQPVFPLVGSGTFVDTGTFQAMLDDLFSKAGRPANDSVLMVFRDRYLARTGLVGPGNTTVQNTWRNHFNIQKGVGCYTQAAELLSPGFLDASRTTCPHLLPGQQGPLVRGRCALGPPTAPEYRREDHPKWLHIDDQGRGYQVVDLGRIATFADYVAPTGTRIPVVPLIVALYHNASPLSGLPQGQSVDLAGFLSDFSLGSAEGYAYFDVSAANSANAQALGVAGVHAQWAADPAVQAVLAQLPVPPGAPAPQPALPATATQPPNTNSGWTAQQYVSQALTTLGWTVHDVSNQQVGYDLLADKQGQTLAVEVKSSIGQCSPTLTAREHQVAVSRGGSYYLAIVENFRESGTNSVSWIQDPANACVWVSRTTLSHSVARSGWLGVVGPAPT